MRRRCLCGARVSFENLNEVIDGIEIYTCGVCGAGLAIEVKEEVKNEKE